MKIALTQMDIVWESPEANKQICKHLIQNAKDAGCDLIVFPELTLTGFTMRPEQFAPNQDLTFFRELAMQYSIYHICGYIEAIEDNYYNKLALCSPEGTILLDYAKLHPFSYGEESRHYHGGSSTVLVSIPSIPITVSAFICYDLRFPEIFQKVSEQATCIFIIANWPDARIKQWHALLQARAIENQSYIIAANRVGQGNGLTYSASSVIYDPYGVQITPSVSNELIYADIDPELAIRYREEFPVRSDRRTDLY